MTTTHDHEERLCGYRSCRASLEGRHGRTLYCNSECRTLQLTTKIDEVTGVERELRISSGCENPRAQQAEITPRYQDRRHPYAGDRPQWSGYCVYMDCECSCHGGENA